MTWQPQVLAARPTTLRLILIYLRDIPSVFSTLNTIISSYTEGDILPIGHSTGDSLFILYRMIHMHQSLWGKHSPRKTWFAYVVYTFLSESGFGRSIIVFSHVFEHSHFHSSTCFLVHRSFISFNRSPERVGTKYTLPSAISSQSILQFLLACIHD